jgi:CTP:molybdopterin cytidylyltransferase MocA
MKGSVAGLLLAAGAGTRMGQPKALLREADGTPWVARAAGALLAGGCDPVLVVVGAEAPAVRALVPVEATVVPAPDWAEGMGASLRAGLRSLGGSAVAVVVTLVDLPGVNGDVVARVAARAGPATLARAAYRGVPGHPVLLGREHWAGVTKVATGDEGARAYLAGRPVALVECADLGSGLDVDTPPQRRGTVPRNRPGGGAGRVGSAEP